MIGISPEQSNEQSTLQYCLSLGRYGLPSRSSST
nr:MAG TPA: hypothetical protein [Caudoviricetes sp.]